MLISLASSWNRKLAHDSWASDAFVTVNGGVVRVEGVLAVGSASSLIHPPEGVLIDCSLSQGHQLLTVNSRGDHQRPGNWMAKTLAESSP